MKYKSCRMLEHGIYFYMDPGTQKLCVGHCCNTDHLEVPERLYLYNDLVNQKLEWDYIFEEKRKLRENAKKGIYPIQCDGCFELHEEDWSDDDYINHITAGHIMKCNSRCIYCPTGRIPEWHNREQDYDFKSIIEELTKKKLLRYDGSLRFVGGEPTLMKEFDWLVDLFSEHNVPEIYVPTSGIRLSKSLCKALEKVESAAIVASIDSGCEETFEKVKGTKFYNLVNKNMETYLKHAREKNFVIPKYILLTNYNDSAEEIEKWLGNTNKSGYVEVQFDSEHSVSSSENCENKKYINRTLKMLEYTELVAKKYNIKVTSFLAFMNRAKRIYEEQIKCFCSNEDLHSNKEIDYCKKYRNLYIDIDNIDEKYVTENINKIIENENFSPKRIAFITSKNEITKNKNFKKIMLTLLRLGFDLQFETSESTYNKIIDEITKTSHSTITIKTNFIKKLFVKQTYKSDRLGTIAVS